MARWRGQTQARTEAGRSGTAAWRELLAPRSQVSFLVSCGFHTALIVLLSMFVVFVPERKASTLIVSPDQGQRVAVRDQPEQGVIVTDTAAAESMAAQVSTLNLPDTLNVAADTILTDQRPTRRSDHGTLDTPQQALLRAAPRQGGGFQGRTREFRNRQVGTGDGTGSAASEDAVELGLAWLAAHQWQDGGWRLDLTGGPCGGQCRDSGKVATSTGATGLALLPFLGAGYTHLSGEYRDVVYNGLYYLKRRMIKTPHGADLREGTMYAQGIATIALCEAYAMTQDPELREPAQLAINYICYAQHSAGGWRYEPGIPGDTTVFGWQMMALKSAAMAGLDVPSTVVRLGERFLDSVQSANGAYYGYTVRGKSDGPTAVGLLVRMYTGWPHDDPRLDRGTQFLLEKGPSTHDMYFNYYAAQVLHHYGGPRWPVWNVEMRDYLVKSQATTGHERGSWFYVDQHGSQGGRLYTTAMCIMILEVYYRHMPLYQEMAAGDDWW